MLNRKYIFKWWIFHCYVRLPECTLPETNIAPDNWWLETTFLLKWPIFNYFQGLWISFWEGSWTFYIFYTTWKVGGRPLPLVLIYHGPLRKKPPLAIYFRCILILWFSTQLYHSFSSDVEAFIAFFGKTIVKCESQIPGLLLFLTRCPRCLSPWHSDSHISPTKGRI